ncbi:TIGR01777 family oxidoreductase [Microlunatus sp. Gsoil 973]|uniref:TIGR01777 family oxidoreductase n=1 Tax=Microlunatus sp. Gsoil 973 TaxID=2672569 RepID=UPI0012B4ECCD|nr:TIGR01777 family oxidoreductase [Microlunatus sp. Gsoil 973]QGN33371.1 TIGR01777 family protein [Microlunatus sp. Gsoil 973]
MRILIAGSSGFLGTALRVRLAQEGHEVRRLIRSGAISSSEFHWEPETGRINARALDDIDVIVNLAGPPVFTRPWTTGRRELLRTARTESTLLLAETIVEQYADSARKPLWLQASACGWYGTDPVERLRAEPYDESDPAGDDFLGRLAHDWEGAAQQAVDAGVRVCFLRNGLVLDRSGSVLKLIKPVFGSGLGGRLGSGRQRMPVISLHDWLRAVSFLMSGTAPAGPYNLTIPKPPTNAEFTAALAQALHSRARLAAPGVILRTALGELAEQLVADQYVVPHALQAQGFTFDGPDIAATLRLALRRD